MKICFTGGGSAGHVTPNIALMTAVCALGWQVSYIGSHHGIEKFLIGEQRVPYYPIVTGKLRRELSLRNLLTPFQVIAGIVGAYLQLGKIRPDVVFSKGGYVGFPVVVAAKLRGIPVLAHESDMSPGLANKMSFPFVDKLFVSFDKTKEYCKKQDKIAVSGAPIREALFKGSKTAGLDWCGFTEDKPVVLVMGGGLGAQTINEVLRRALPELLKHYQVVHSCGAGKVSTEFQHLPGYKQVEYITSPLPDVYAVADCVISRAGANSLYELLLLHKPHILIPLGTKASRGDQILNAEFCEGLGFSRVIHDAELNETNLQQHLAAILSDAPAITQTLQGAGFTNGVDIILETLKRDYASGAQYV